MEQESKIGIDLGGTNLRAGWINNDETIRLIQEKLHPGKGKNQIIEQIIEAVNQLKAKDVTGIGIGVPSVVDPVKGIVYHATNIPEWDEVHLKDILENKFNIPVYVNNDVNCFVLGEHRYGTAHGHSSAVGLSIGTGLGAGIIINNQLYNGNNSGAGEIGLLPYLDRNLEYYCSSSFFAKIHQIEGEHAFVAAQNGDQKMLSIWAEFGRHMAEAIKYVVLTYDPEVIVLGGSIANAFELFKESLYERLYDFAFPYSMERLAIHKSKNKQSSLLGATLLF